mmetsp:Transcript_27281/g.69957  ORF Transcript_27281/g.69957 Transcript_27281/m.69957 type:complete len:93 (+) Transcript_27281:68-346(+)
MSCSAIFAQVPGELRAFDAVFRDAGARTELHREPLQPEGDLDDKSLETCDIFPSRDVLCVAADCFLRPLKTSSHYAPVMSLTIIFSREPKGP